MKQALVEGVLQWIPGHIGINVDKAADTIAKQGAALPQLDIPLTYDTAAQNNQDKHRRRLGKRLGK